MGCVGEAPADAPAAVCSHWFSASGALDVYIFAGASPREVTRQHAALTGVTPLPPLFALGYHQCRWNYRDEEDVGKVHAAFDEHRLACRTERRRAQAAHDQRQDWRAAGNPRRARRSRGRRLCRSLCRRRVR